MIRFLSKINKSSDIKQSKNHHSHEGYGEREIREVVQIDAMKMTRMVDDDQRDVVLGTVG